MASQAHTILRVFEVLTLVPAWGLLSGVIAWYNSKPIRTPGNIITLFVTTLLASVWAFCILIATLRARNTALWITFWDLAAMGLLIAGVASTANIVNHQCSEVRVFVDGQVITVPGTDIWGNPANCGLIRGAWALALVNIILFFVSAIAAAVVYRSNSRVLEVDRRRRGRRRETVVTEVPVVVEKYPPIHPQRPRRARISRGRSQHGSSRYGSSRREDSRHGGSRHGGSRGLRHGGGARYGGSRYGG